MWKKIIAFFYLFIVFFVPVIVSADWDVEIDLTIDREEASLDDVFTISVNIKKKWNIESWNLIVEWILDNFLQRWQSNSTNISMINWNFFSTEIKSLSLEAIDIWEYEIWPAIFTYDWKSIKSNIVNIKISEEKDLFWLENTNSENIKSAEEDNKKEFLEEKESKTLFDYLFYFLLFILFIFISLFYKFLLYSKKEEKTNEENRKKEELHKISNLKISEIDLDSENFVSDLNSSLQKYFKLKYNINIKTKTFSEAFDLLADKLKNQEKKDLYKDLFDLVSKISYLESNQYDKERVNTLIREINILS